MTVQVLVKIVVTALLITGITEIMNRKVVIVAALLGALPIVTVLAMIWMHVEGQEESRIAAYSTATFWLVLPTLPMFLVYPWLSDKGMSFWPALLISIAIMLVLYFALAAYMSMSGNADPDMMQKST